MIQMITLLVIELADLRYNNGMATKFTDDLSPYVDKSLKKITLEDTYGDPSSSLGNIGTFYVR